MLIYNRIVVHLLFHMSFLYINDFIFFNYDSYFDSMLYQLYTMCTYCIIVYWNPDIELLRCYMPEFFMLFFIFVLFTYCILSTFSSVLSEEQFFCQNTPIGFVRRITSNKQLPSRLITYFPPMAWIYRWERKRCEFINISGETAGSNMYGLSLLLVFCTILLVIVFDSHIEFSNTPFSDFVLLRNRFDYNSIIELVVLGISVIIFFVTYSYNIEIGISSFEYYIIMLFCICSFCFFLHATNLIFLYVLIELQSISSYVLTSFNKRTRYSVESGLKYFILGSFTSILLVFGFSLLYGFSGMLHFDDLSIFIMYVKYKHAYLGFLSFLFYISLLCILTGFLFKIYASPFHFWVADIYQGSPTCVTIFLSTIPVLSYSYVFIKLYVQMLSNFFYNDVNILFYLSIFSLISGIAGALVQKKIKKLIAYSSVTTIGYVLASLSCHSIVLVQYSLFYLFIYMLNILPIFILLLNYRVNNVKIIDSMYGFVTLFYQNKVLFVLFFSFFFSLAGIPPFAGFFSKLYIFSALGNVSSYLLLCIGICAALLSCYYYVRVIKMVYYDYNNASFFISSISYYNVFICVLFFIVNLLFFFFSSIIEDISLYIALSIT